MNGPVPYLKGKWSECHRVRNAKRPREGSNSRTVSNYYIDYSSKAVDYYLKLYVWFYHSYKATLWQWSQAHSRSEGVFSLDAGRTDNNNIILQYHNNVGTQEDPPDSYVVQGTCTPIQCVCLLVWCGAQTTTPPLLSYWVMRRCKQCRGNLVTGLQRATFKIATHITHAASDWQSIRGHVNKKNSKNPKRLWKWVGGSTDQLEI